MISPKRLLLAAVITLTAGAGAAAAQTVILRHAPAGSAAEFVLDNATVASASANAEGDATLVAPPAATGAATVERRVNIYVDLCESVRRVVIVERDVQPAAPAALCSRRPIPGVFILLPVSTLVIDIGPAVPTVLLRQGVVDLTATASSRETPTGFMAFAGGGLATFRDATLLACGAVEGCERTNRPWAYALGGEYWLTPYFAAEVSYVKPSKVKIAGTGDDFHFDSDLDAHLAIAAAKVGLPLGPMRFYGKGGATYHRAAFGTTQTIDELTFTQDGVTVTIPGGTQTYARRTAGWGWIVAGGAEAWVASRLALYAEAGLATVKGDPVGLGETKLDDRAKFVIIGLKFRVRR